MGVLEALGQAGIGCEIMNTSFKKKKKKKVTVKGNGLYYYNSLTAFLGEGQKRSLTS